MLSQIIGVLRYPPQEAGSSDDQSNAARRQYVRYTAPRGLTAGDVAQHARAYLNVFFSFLGLLFLEPVGEVVEGCCIGVVNGVEDEFESRA